VGSATCEGWGWQGRLLPVEVLSACAWLATSGPVLARFMVHQLRLPRPLVIYPWLWLAAKADDLDRKRHCLQAVLQVDPENEPASLAPLLLHQQRPPS
jgi:hypothetical protein